MRVLIVEDDFLIALDLENLLADAGCKIVGVAERCRTAIAMVEAERPHLVIMDISLAGKRDGVEAATIIRERYDIATLFVSGEFSSELARRAQAAEPLGWLSKPVDKQQLLTVVALTRERLTGASGKHFANP